MKPLRTSIFLLLLIALFSFSSCVGPQKAPPSTQPPERPEPVKKAPQVKAPPTRPAEKRPVQRPRVEPKKEPPRRYFSSLSELTNTLASDLKGRISPCTLYLDSAAIRDACTKDVSNFSAFLQNELEASLSRQGFTMVYEPYDAGFFIDVTYQRSRGRTKVFFKYHKSDGSGKKSLAYEIEDSSLPAESFAENLKSKAYRLAANILKGQEGLSIYIKPIVEGNKKYQSEFSNSFTERLKSRIVSLKKKVEIIDEEPIKKKLSNTRGIKMKAAQVKNLETSDAFFASANSILEGKYFVRGKQVTVDLYLKDLKGKILNSAEVDIEKSLISSSLENEKAEKLVEIADVVEEKNDAKVKLSTTKGGDYAVYHGGEKILFHIQVGKPMFVYLYNITPEGNVELLYPYTEDELQRPLLPGRLYTIPSEADEFELEVCAPFGTDAVKIFASPLRLPFPGLDTRVASRSFRGGTRAIGKRRKNIQQSLASEKQINPRDLVDYYRGIANRFNTDICEDSVIIETKKRF